jgi:N-acetylglucosaminyldiphosphoundecaprenol N-acetyl-beta-D-mannosaminyltransferase
MHNEVLVSGLPERSAAGSPRYQVGTVHFSRTHYGNVVASLESFFQDRPANNYVCVSNVHTTVECGSDERLRRIQNGSYLTIADGQAVIYYAKFAGAPEAQRIMGPDLMTEVFNAPEARDRRHYFLGGAPGTLASMERNLRAKFPLLQIAGLHSPPFRKLTPEEGESLRRDILAAAPDYLWVCFGAPKQEYWMEENHGRYPGILLIGIGAGFAYHAGELKRAPMWAQKLACEWVWRLMQDPKRLWKRYLKTNPVFIGMFLKRVAIRILLRR